MAGRAMRAAAVLAAALVALAATEARAQGFAFGQEKSPGPTCIQRLFGLTSACPSATFASMQEARCRSGLTGE